MRVPSPCCRVPSHPAPSRAGGSTYFSWAGGWVGLAPGRCAPPCSSTWAYSAHVRAEDKRLSLATPARRKPHFVTSATLARQSKARAEPCPCCWRPLQGHAAQRPGHRGRADHSLVGPTGSVAPTRGKLRGRLTERWQLQEVLGHRKLFLCRQGALCHVSGVRSKKALPCLLSPS